MVLSIEELEAAENLDDGRNRMSSLMRLRDSTRSFIIQCLADREIQNELNITSKAYRYNCAVVHQPHKWVQVQNLIFSVIRCNRFISSPLMYREKYMDCAKGQHLCIINNLIIMCKQSWSRDVVITLFIFTVCRYQRPRVGFCQ